MVQQGMRGFTQETDVPRGSYIISSRQSPPIAGQEIVRRIKKVDLLWCDMPGMGMMRLNRV
jgi:hypothetical protein